MQTELQTSLILQMAAGADSNCDTDDPGQITSSPTHVAPQHPAKKQTRQWAAWTRQEEESFFSALRQVGKNFEKITSLVQSKNKNQVRHYYYRLVRRMNKLLGPGFCLDAKNSKETIAAMLRWWSLLEKYSCKASKLHLKPRRFKIFMDAFEHQLLKDRKKNTRKRPAGENCYTAPPTVLNHSRLSGNDGRAAKDILLDSQNIPKSGPGKTPAPKHNVGANRNISKRDSSTGKTTRQRRKPAGPVSSAAYKRWEKAAIAGVSLVADAAEHLERTATDNEVELGQGQTSSNPVADMPSLPTFSLNPFAENNTQSSSIKLKLQLFPIDEATRKALEMDQHNPHLELTLSIRKKISSVLDHLTRKWGDSSVASGELMVFPYSAQRENLRASLRWAQDSLVSAADVYSLIGRPEVFRLRYGWLSMTELGSTTHEHEVPLGACHVSREHAVHVNVRDEQAVDWSIPPPLTDNQDENLVSSLKDKTSVTEKSHPLQSSTFVPDEIKYAGATCFNNRIISFDPATNITWHGTENQDGLRLNHGTAMSAKEWADSLTNISVGDLLSEPSDKMNVERSLCSQALSFTCDSFDAAIAAHISKNQDKMGLQPTLEPYTSLWDAEETCDAFSFQKNPVTCQEVRDTSRPTSSVPFEPIYRMNVINTGGVPHELPEVEGQNYGTTREYLIKKCDSSPQAPESAANDLGGLTDIYWPESLGPLDLDIPSSRYHCNDLILTDSLSSLKCLIATSLDAFQNSSFFGMEMKEPTSTVEPRETPICPHFKIGSGL